MTEWKGGTPEDRELCATVFALLRQPNEDGLLRLASTAAPLEYAVCHCHARCKCDDLGSAA